MTDDAFQEVVDIVERLKRITEHSDGVVSVQINAKAWNQFASAVRNSPSLKGMMLVEGVSHQGRRFEVMGVEFCDYDRASGLSSTRR